MRRIRQPCCGDKYNIGVGRNQYVSNVFQFQYKVCSKVGMDLAMNVECTAELNGPSYVDP